MRDFIRDYNERFGATVLLTSHYMDDVVALCPRVVVIDHGRLIYDGDLHELVRRVRPDKRVTVRLSRAGRARRAREAGDRRLGRRGAGGAVGAARALQAVVRDALAALPIVDLTDRGSAARGGDARAVPRGRRERAARAATQRRRRGTADPPARLRQRLAAARLPDAAARRLLRGGRLPRRVPGLDPHHQHAARHAGALARGGGATARSAASTSAPSPPTTWACWRCACSPAPGWSGSCRWRSATARCRPSLLRPIHPLVALRGRAPLGGADARAGHLAGRRRSCSCSGWRSAAAPRPACCWLILLASLVGAWLLIFFTMVLIGSLAFFVESALGDLRALAGRARHLLGLPGPARAAAALGARRRATCCRSASCSASRSRRWSGCCGRHEALRGARPPSGATSALFGAGGAAGSGGSACGRSSALRRMTCRDAARVRRAATLAACFGVQLRDRRRSRRCSTAPTSWCAASSRSSGWR